MNAVGPRVEIFDSDDPPAYTGSLYLSGRGYALTNLRKDLTDRETWNTLSMRVEGRRIQVWLNAAEVGAALIEGPDEGQIGIHLESAPDPNAGEIQIREIQVKKLPKPDSAKPTTN